MRVLVLPVSVLVWVVAMIGGGPTADRAVSSDARPAVTAAPAQESAESLMAAVTAGVTAAAEQGVEQSVAVVDRTTGEMVASIAGDRGFNTESVLKLFTAAYYLSRDAGGADEALHDTLRTMITRSDNDIQSELWQYDIVPTIAERYSLQNTTDGPNPSDHTWGSDRTTADDQATFLFRMSLDPAVGPLLLSWMADIEPFGADGFDQVYGLYSVPGERGAKQGWSDSGWTPANLHSVGWTSEFFVAILLTSPTASYATMRATSTFTALGINSAAADSALSVIDRIPAVLDEITWQSRKLARQILEVPLVDSTGIGRVAVESFAELVSC